MKNIFLSFCALTIVAFSACKKSNNTPSNTATVMFVDGCAGTTNINAAVNTTAVAGATNLAFLKNSGYQSVTAGSGVTFAYTLTSTGTPLTNTSANLTANTYYSAYAGGLITGASLVLVADDLSAPSAGMAKVRFINLSSDGLNLSCYIGSNKIDSNVSYKTCTSFSEIAAVTANVLLQDPAVPTNLAQLNAQAFTAGKIYTVMLTGTSTGTGVSALTATVVGNN